MPRLGTTILLLAGACTSDAEPTTEELDPEDSGNEQPGQRDPSPQADAGGEERGNEPLIDPPNDTDDDFLHTCTVGDELCVCYPNDTCNADLSCEDGVCRDASSDTADEPAQSSMGGTGAAPSAGNGAGGGAPFSGDAGVVPTPSGGTSGGGSPTGGSSASGSSAGGSSAGGNGAGGSSAAGGSPVVPDDGRCATVLLLVDRSTSMFSSALITGDGTPVGMYDDGWEAARAAISTLEPYASEVAFGAMTFAAPGRTTCPVLQGAEMVPALDAFNQVLSLLPPNSEAIPDEKADTPMVESLQAAYAILDGVGGTAPKYVVLVSDGSAEMCAVRDRGAWCGQDPAIGAVQDAFERGIATLAVGIDPSDSASEYLLDAVAFAGRGEAIPPAPRNESLPCLQIEFPAITGEPAGDDLYTGEAWRDYAQAEYGPANSTFPVRRFFEVDPADVTVAMDALMATIGCEE